MGSVDTTRREVDRHESKGNPHPDSASINDTTSTAEVQRQALAYDFIGV